MNLPGIRYTVCNTNLNPSYAIQTACCQPHHKNNPKFTRDKKKKGQSTTSTTAKRVSSERGQCDSSADQSGARPAGSRDPVVRPLIYIRLMASCLLRGDNLTVR